MAVPSDIEIAQAAPIKPIIEIAKKLGDEACLVFQVEGEEQFNRWSRRVAAKHIKDGMAVVYLKIKKMKPVRSRIEKLELVKPQSL